MKLKDKFLSQPEKLQDLEIELKVEIASKQIPLKDVLNLKEGGVFIFDENLDEPLSIIIQDKKIAEATLVKINEDVLFKPPKIFAAVLFHFDIGY